MHLHWRLEVLDDWIHWLRWAGLALGSNAVWCCVGVVDERPLPPRPASASIPVQLDGLGQLGEWKGMDGWRGWGEAGWRAYRFRE